MTSNENDDMETSSEENISDNDQEAPPLNKKIQTGMERYITITGKKKQKPTTNNEQVKPNEDTTTTNPGSSNYYSILADKSNDVNETIRKTTKPPPIYIRQAASNKLTTEIGKIVGADNFYIVDLKRGDIKETKVQVVSEVKYTALVNWLDSKKMQYYTYQLKSAKGLKAVIKAVSAQELIPTEGPLNERRNVYESSPCQKFMALECLPHRRGLEYYFSEWRRVESYWEIYN
ncbi:unnamed protein product [Hermetia illucens]|uniref:Uncharacterized protein n=1 Tax=Hermetia illucens TaxID=343691 RepID=A0A7R8Z1Q8_HERIL|nr:unnamed protein product [Hermetia illucens]